MEERTSARSKGTNRVEVPEENIKRFQKSVRYKRSEDKEAGHTPPDAL